MKVYDSYEMYEIVHMNPKIEHFFFAIRRSFIFKSQVYSVLYFLA
jgi:hypothetical protein